MPERYLLVSKSLIWDEKKKKYVLQKGGVTHRGAPITQKMLKTAIWDAKQRRKRELREAKRKPTL